MIRRVLAFLALVLARMLTAQDAPAWSARLDSLILAELGRTNTPGVQVAVAHQGRVVYSRGYGVSNTETGRAVTPQTLFRVGSVTKMVTGALLAQLAVDGKLDLRAPISRYVTELSGGRVGSVTTHQLLTHSAGWTDNATAYGRMGEGALGEVMTVQSDTLFFTEPGRVLSYSNPGYAMAGYVAERAAGRRYGDLVEELVLRRVGMLHATFRPLHAMTRDFSQGHVGNAATPAIVRPFTENTAQWAAGFLMASAQDMARFTIAVMDSGRLDGIQVFPAAAVRLMTAGDPVLPGETSRYAFGLVIGTRGGEPFWSHGGSINGFDSQVTMFPARQLSIVVADNRAGVPLQGIVDFVAREVAGLVPPTPPAQPAPRTPTAAERAQLVGTYRQSTTEMTLFVVGDTLKLRRGPTEGVVRLIGDDRIQSTPTNAPPSTVILVRGSTGRVEYLSVGLRALARQ